MSPGFVASGAPSMFETNPGGQDNPTDMPAPDTPEQPEDDDQDEEPQPEPAS